MHSAGRTVKTVAVAIVLLPALLALTVGRPYAVTGDVLYQNCADGGCTGAGSKTGWIREVVTGGCRSGECLKLTAGYNSGTGLYGAGSTSIAAPGIAGRDEITVVYYQKFNASVRTLSGANVKAIRPYVGDASHYFMATIAGYNLVKKNDFYISHNKGTLAPTAIFDPLDENDTWTGDRRYTVPNGDGTWDVPAGRIAGKFNQGGHDGFGTQWTKVRQWIKLPSTPTGTDGESKLWINDVLAFHLYNAAMSSGSRSTFSGFTFYPSSEATEAFEHWMDDMVIYEGYVPPTKCTVAWDSGTYSVDEGIGTARFTIARSGETTDTATVTWVPLQGSAAAGEDFENAARQTAAFAPGERSKEIHLRIEQDEMVEGDETFTISLAEPVECDLGTTTKAEVTIIDDDDGMPEPVAAFSSDPMPASGTAPFTVQFTDRSTGRPTSWEWDFDGDGQVDATGPNPEFIYMTDGEYTVTLTAVNAAGQDTATMAVSVEADNTIPSGDGGIGDDSGDSSDSGCFVNACLSQRPPAKRVAWISGHRPGAQCFYCCSCNRVRSARF